VPTATTLPEFNAFIALLGIFLLGIVIRWVRVLSRPRGERRNYLIYRAIRRMVTVAVVLLVVLIVEGGWQHAVATGASVPLYVRIIFGVAFALQVMWLGFVVYRVIQARAAWVGKPSAEDALPYGRDEPPRPL
jgi:hypothetical protein